MAKIYILNPNNVKKPQTSDSRIKQHTKWAHTYTNSHTHTHTKSRSKNRRKMLFIVITKINKQQEQGTE